MSTARRRCPTRTPRARCPGSWPAAGSSSGGSATRSAGSRRTASSAGRCWSSTPRAGSARPPCCGPRSARPPSSASCPSGSPACAGTPVLPELVAGVARSLERADVVPRGATVGALAHPAGPDRPRARRTRSEGVRRRALRRPAPGPPDRPGRGPRGPAPRVGDGWCATAAAPGCWCWSTSCTPPPREELSLLLNALQNLDGAPRGEPARGRRRRAPGHARGDHPGGDLRRAQLVRRPRPAGRRRRAGGRHRARRGARRRLDRPGPRRRGRRVRGLPLLPPAARQRELGGRRAGARATGSGWPTSAPASRRPRVRSPRCTAPAGARPPPPSSRSSPRWRRPVDGNVSRAQIAATLGQDSRAISVPRERLIDKGVIEPVGHGLVRFTLPGFAAYVRQRTDGG